MSLCLFLAQEPPPQWARSSSFTRFLDHTRLRTTVGRSPLDERSPRRRDLYLTTHNTQNRNTSMPPVGFEPTISAGEQPQIYALDRAATGAGIVSLTHKQNAHIQYNTHLNPYMFRCFLCHLQVEFCMLINDVIFVAYIGLRHNFFFFSNCINVVNLYNQITVSSI